MTFSWRLGRSLSTATDRFYIRSMTVDDINGDYQGWWNDEEIQAGLNMPPRGWGQVECRAHVQKFDNRTKFHLGIFEKAKSKQIGFYAIFLNPTSKVASSNVVIGDKTWWGQGVVQEVRGHMLHFIFGELGANKLKGEISGRNIPSIFNYQVQGFTLEGTLRQEALSPGGEYVDKLIFGLLKSEWAKQ